MRASLARAAPRDCRRRAAACRMRDTPRMPRRPPARLLRALVVGLLAAAIAGGVAAAGALDRFEGDSSTRASPCAARMRRRTSPSSTSTRPRRPASVPLPRAVARARDPSAAGRGRAHASSTTCSSPSRRTARDDRALLRAAAIRASCSGGRVFEDGDRRRSSAASRSRRAADAGRHGPRSRSTPTASGGAWRPASHGLPALAVLAAGGTCAPASTDRLRRPAGHRREISFLDVVDGQLDRAAVRGRIVVVGATAPHAAGRCTRPRRRRR